MIDVEEFDKETSERFSVVSYNTLAQNACKEVPYCRPQHLTPVGRRKLFHREIADLDADILGLQDVDNYDIWWREMLSSLGYDSVFKRRSQARGSWEEGLVLAWRRTRFQLVASHAFDFNDVPAEGTVQGYLVQDNVAQMVALQPFERSRAPTGLCVANAQLCRLPGREDVRLAQARRTACWPPGSSPWTPRRPPAPASRRWRWIRRARFACDGRPPRLTTLPSALTSKDTGFNGAQAGIALWDLRARSSWRTRTPRCT